MLCLEYPISVLPYSAYVLTLDDSSRPLQQHKSCISIWLLVVHWLAFSLRQMFEKIWFHIRFSMYMDGIHSCVEINHLNKILVICNFYKNSNIVEHDLSILKVSFFLYIQWKQFNILLCTRSFSTDSTEPFLGSDVALHLTILKSISNRTWSLYWLFFFFFWNVFLFLF